MHFHTYNIQVSRLVRLKSVFRCQSQYAESLSQAQARYAAELSALRDQLHDADARGARLSREVCSGVQPITYHSATCS